ncbi:hypothetical protein [Nocardia sp. NPDC051570]|uniref:hypothetical protein n=1 Tax=Nocardia sp. NPDC051570 TaxID=3364324 RepID=UPI00378A3ED3
MEGEARRDVENLADTVRRELKHVGMDIVDTFAEVALPAPTAHSAELDRVAEHVVSRDLELLEESDVVLMDMTISSRNYIGCSCELVYARLLNLPVFVYVGSTGYAERYWLRYHATSIAKTRSQSIDEIVAWSRRATEYDNA